MSELLVRKALEKQLATVAGTMPVAYENANFEPATGTAYLQANVMRARPLNPTLGAKHARLQGVFQVMVRYPQGSGPLACETKAQAIADAFARGTVLVEGAARVLIVRTAWVGFGRAEAGEWWTVPVSIDYSADIFS